MNVLNFGSILIRSSDKMHTSGPARCNPTLHTGGDLAGCMPCPAGSYSSGVFARATKYVGSGRIWMRRWPIVANVVKSSQAHTLSNEHLWMRTCRHVGAGANTCLVRVIANRAPALIYIYTIPIRALKAMRPMPDNQHNSICTCLSKSRHCADAYIKPVPLAAYAAATE